MKELENNQQELIALTKFINSKKINQSSRRRTAINRYYKVTRIQRNPIQVRKIE